jgi:hypothetical protein
MQGNTMNTETTLTLTPAKTGPVSKRFAALTSVDDTTLCQVFTDWAIDQRAKAQETGRAWASKTDQKTVKSPTVWRLSKPQATANGQTVTVLAESAGLALLRSGPDLIVWPVAGVTDTPEGGRKWRKTLAGYLDL